MAALVPTPLSVVKTVVRDKHRFGELGRYKPIRPFTGWPIVHHASRHASTRHRPPCKQVSAPLCFGLVDSRPDDRLASRVQRVSCTTQSYTQLYRRRSCQSSPRYSIATKHACTRESRRTLVVSGVPRCQPTQVRLLVTECLVLLLALAHRQ